MMVYNLVRVLASGGTMHIHDMTLDQIEDLEGAEEETEQTI